MRLYAISVFSCVVFLETTAFLLHEASNTFYHDCLPAACDGCMKWVQSTFIGMVSSYRIKCNDVGLTSFPIVKSIDMSINLSTVSIDYSGNHFRAVPANVFSNIHPRGHSFYAQIYLNNNLISRIDLNAFNGIADRIDKLYISHNKLDHLPGALSKLGSLLELRINNNPIRHVDSAVTSALGSHLSFLWIDLGHVSSWPVGINNLHKVAHLFLYNITVELKDINIFHGLTGLRSELLLDYKVKDHGPSFLAIPPAVTRLPHFTYLRINGEVYCTCGLSYLAHWKLPEHFNTACHGTSRDSVKHYITNIASHCHG